MASEPTSAELVERVRALCLTFPDAVERETWGHPTFRVRNRIFATCGSNDDGQVTVAMKADPDEHGALLAMGKPFFLPAYVGSKGWIGITVEAHTDWSDVAELLTTSYCLIAPKHLSERASVPSLGGHKGTE